MSEYDAVEYNRFKEGAQFYVTAHRHTRVLGSWPSVHDNLVQMALKAGFKHRPMMCVVDGFYCVFMADGEVAPSFWCT